jgi:hypothetical protein
MGAPPHCGGPCPRHGEPGIGARVSMPNHYPQITLSLWSAPFLVWASGTPWVMGAPTQWPTSRIGSEMWVMIRSPDSLGKHGRVWRLALLQQTYSYKGEAHPCKTRAKGSLLGGPFTLISRLKATYTSDKSRTCCRTPDCCKSRAGRRDRPDRMRCPRYRSRPDR